MVHFNQQIQQLNKIIEERKCGVDGLAIDIGISYSSLRKFLRLEYVGPKITDKISNYLSSK